MATGTTGAPWSIPYPVGADTYALTSDLAGMAVRVAAGLSTVQATHDTDLEGVRDDVAGVISAVGTPTVALDTDGTPYIAATGATHYILTDDEGPYITSSLVPTVTRDGSGTPILS